MASISHYYFKIKIEIQCVDNFPVFCNILVRIPYAYISIFDKENINCFLIKFKLM